MFTFSYLSLSGLKTETFRHLESALAWRKYYAEKGFPVTIIRSIAA
jgi:hypothetical protein